MTPGPGIDQLIATIRSEAAGNDVLDQLAQASRTVAALEEVADATLAHFVDQCRRNGRSWSEISHALGVSKQAAHKRFSLPAPPLDRFTPRASAALRAAAEAARALGHSSVGTEHILLGLFEPSGGIAARIFDETGISRARVEDHILAVTSRSSSPGATDPDPPFTPRALESLDRAAAVALSLRHNYVGTEHLLLAQFGDPDGLAAKILSDLGADLDDYRRRVLEKLAAISRPSS